MAARLLLLGFLFMEILEPIAGISDLESNGVKRSGLKLQIAPSGNVVLGKKGVTIGCTANSNRNVSWLYNGAPAPPCGTLRCSLLRNGSLHFYRKQNSPTTQKYTGREEGEEKTLNNELRCYAKTDQGGILRSSPVYLQIAEFSYNFKESPQDLTVLEGEVARFHCAIDSLPSPANVTWQKNGENLPQYNPKYSTIPPGLLFVSTSNSSDSGSYRCTATNDYLKKSKKSKEAKLIVLKKSDETPRAAAALYPQIISNYTLISGSKLVLVCAASGHPAPMLTWTFIPHLSNENDIAQPRMLLNESTGIKIFKINNISVSDIGVYQCSARNSTRNIEIQNVTVDVLVPPTFIKKPSNQVCPNGRTARFECQADGVPKPQIYWLKDATNVTINGRRTTYAKENNKVELAISATVPKDAGIYQCVAVNPAGEIWAAGRLQVNTSRNSPAVPTSIKCRALSPSRMLITWIPPKSLPYTSITAYTVHYSPAEGGKEEVSPPEPGNSTSIEITKVLEPYTNYSFYIRVWNSHGASDQSTSIVCATAASVPKAVPKINVSAISNTALNVSWSPLSKKEACGVIVEYKLQWKLHMNPSSHVLSLPSNIQHYILTDLVPGAQYDLRILARTEKGWPELSETHLPWTNVTMPSSEALLNTGEIVDLKMEKINSTSIQITWTMNVDKEEYKDLKFDFWKVYCEPHDGHNTSAVLLAKDETEYLFTKLDTNYSYTISLCMMNGDEMLSCLTKRLESLPLSTINVPTALEASPASPRSINIMWTVSNKDSMDSYEICYNPVHSSDMKSVKCIIANETKATISKLKPFTLYQFKVRALTNITDKSPIYSESIECYTEEDIPGQMDELEWFVDNGTKIRVAWKQPKRSNGIIQNFTVFYSLDSDFKWSSWETIAVPGNVTSTTLPIELSTNRYVVKVKAATKAGYGEFSPSITITSGVAPKSPNSLGNDKSPQKTNRDKSLGIILGVGISICCITICLCSIYCRKKYENSRSLRESTQSLKIRKGMRNGNGYIDQASMSAVQQVNSAIASNEIELVVLRPATAAATSAICDPKGNDVNGGAESCAKEPLLTSWNLSKNIRVTDHSKYKRSSNALSKHLEQDQNLNSTQLTTISTLDSSDSSTNNNLEYRDTLGSPTSLHVMSNPHSELHSKG